MAKRKYLITISDLDSKRVLVSFKGSRFAFTTGICAVVVIIMALTYILTSRTPVRNTIPGYPSEESRQQAFEAVERADSLERLIGLWNFQVTNIRRVIEGMDPLPLDSITLEKQDLKVDDGTRALYNGSDSIIRSEVIAQDRFEINRKHTGAATTIEGMHFFTPVQGVITQRFDKTINHPSVDIAAKDGSVIHAILDGTVISAFWDEMTGNNIIIQHSNDIISIFRHNEKLLKKSGDAVRAGDAVAIIGSTGTTSTGTHLHFEMWYKGKPVDPEKYIKF